MNRVGAPDGPRRSLRKPEESHLARAHQLGHRTDGLFDRRLRIDAMLVVEVDAIDAQALERSVARLAHVFRASVGRRRQSVRPALVAELGRDYHTIAHPPERLTDQYLVGERTVNVCGIEKVDAEFERAFE